MRHRLRSYFKKNWRAILNALMFAALALLIFLIKDQILETIRNIKHVHYWVLLFIIPLQLVNYDSYARMYRTTLRQLGSIVRYRDMYRVALELNFVNHVLPSGGVSGFSYFSVRLRDFNVRPSTATIVQLLRFFLGFLSFQILLGFGLVALAVGGKASNIVILVATSLTTLTFVGTFLVAYIIGDNGRINGTSAFLVRQINYLIGLVRRGNPETINLNKLKNGMDEVHKNYLVIKDNLGILKRGLLYGLIVNITEVLTIYVVYIAFGEYVNIGAVIIAYAIANFAGLVSVLPGGVGVYEGLMTGTLAAAGVPPALSIPVTVMYRVLSVSVQILPGWILYHLHLSSSDDSKSQV